MSRQPLPKTTDIDGNLTREVKQVDVLYAASQRVFEARGGFLAGLTDVQRRETISGLLDLMGSLGLRLFSQAPLCVDCGEVAEEHGRRYRAWLDSDTVRERVEAMMADNEAATGRYLAAVEGH